VRGHPVPAIPASIKAPIRDQCSALLPAREASHPLGCHRPRLPDRVVFDQRVRVLVFGCAAQRITDATVATTPLRRRRDEWITAGVIDTVLGLMLGACGRLIGLKLADLRRDYGMTKASCGGGVAGRTPVDRGTQGLDRSLAVDAAGISPAIVIAFWMACSPVIFIVGRRMQEAWTRARWDERRYRKP
jgi:hypothetical protein